MHPAFADFRFAVRGYFGRPAGSLVATALLTLGIAANISTLAVIESLWINPSPSAHPAKLAQSRGSNRLGAGEDGFAPSAQGTAWWDSDGTHPERGGVDQKAPEGPNRPLTQEGHGERTLSALSAAASFLFLIACANAASLVVVHSRSRQTELAILRAMRTGTTRLIRRWAWEAVLTSGLAGLCGLVASNWAIGFLEDSWKMARHGIPPFRIDTAAFALVATAIGTLLVLALPAARLARPALSAALGLTGGARTSGGPRLRKTMAVGGLALTLLVLTGSGALLSLWRQPSPARLIPESDRTPAPNFSLAGERTWRSHRSDPSHLSDLSRKVADRVSAPPRSYRSNGPETATGL